MPETISFSEPVESPQSASLFTVPENGATFFDKLYRVFFGDDIFISYSRLDGAAYARSLARLLQKKYRFTAFADFRWSEPGERLPAFLIKKLKRSAVLIVIITKGAVERSANIREEIEVFSKTKRPFFIIDLDSAYHSSEWPELAGINPVKDVSAPGGIVRQTVKPSTAVLQGIRDSFKYKTQYDKQRFSALAAFLLILISILTAIVTGFYSARAVRERDLAYAEKNRVDTELDRANHTKDEALKKVETTNQDLTKTRDDLSRTQGDLAVAGTEKHKVESDLKDIKAERKKAGRELEEKKAEIEYKEARLSQKTEESNHFFYLSEISRAKAFYKSNDMFSFEETLNGIDPEYRETEWQYLSQLNSDEREAFAFEDSACHDCKTTTNADGSRLITADTSGKIILWSTFTGEHLSVLTDSPLSEGKTRTAAFFNNGRYIYSYDGSSDQDGNSTAKNLRIWNGETGKEILEPALECKAISDLVTTRNGNKLFVRCDEKIARWDLNECGDSGEIKTRPGRYLDLLWNEKVITVSDSTDYAEYYYDVETGEELQFDKTGIAKPVAEGILSPDGKWLVYEHDHEYFLRSALDMNNPGDDKLIGRALISGPGLLRDRCAFSNDGRFLLLMLKDGVSKIDLTTLESSTLFSGRPRVIGSLSFSPSGSWGVYMEGPRVEFWDSQTWKRREFPACASFFEFKKWAFTSDERKFITGCDDGTVRIWDLQSGQEGLNFKAVDGKIDELFLSSDERSLLTISGDRPRLWRLKL